MPIILSAPHGGRTAIPNATLRQGLGVEKFETVRDDHTDELAEKIAAALEKKLGGKPFIIIARFERKYADANRDAVFSKSLKPLVKQSFISHRACLKSYHSTHARTRR